MNFYKRYPGDYARDTGHLSLMEHGAYNLLLDRYYSTGSLPSDLEDVHMLCRAHSAAEKRAVDKVMRQFFPDGKNHRADIEIEKWNQKASQNREIGKLGGRPKKPKGNPDGFQTETQTVSESVSRKNPPRSQIPEEEIPYGADAPAGTLKTQIFRLSRQLGIAPGIITTELKAHSEQDVWQALGSTLTAKPGDPLPYFRGVLKPKTRGLVL